MNSRQYSGRAGRVMAAILIVVAISMAGCASATGGYVPAAAISSNGFARDGKAIQALDGQVVKVWGYVDAGNLYGDASARQVLGEWWGGAGPDAATWRFNLKANADDQVGRSFAVSVPNDAGRDAVLTRFLTDARAGQPTRVYLQGRIYTFDAPLNATTKMGLYMELESSQDIRFAAPGQSR